MYHVLHADADFSIAVKSPVEAHNVRRVALMQHLELPYDLVPDGWFNLQVDQLEHGRNTFLVDALQPQWVCESKN